LPLPYPNVAVACCKPGCKKQSRVKIKRERGIILVEISKEQMEYLIKNKILKCKKGQYKDLYISSRNKKSKRKKRYIPDEIYEKYLKKVE